MCVCVGVCACVYVFVSVWYGWHYGYSWLVYLKAFQPLLSYLMQKSVFFQAIIWLQITIDEQNIVLKKLFLTLIIHTQLPSPVALLVDGWLVS